ncbi:MAG: cbb3-type cytochrome c oxidase subunit I [Acidimicrobiia bacterium]
MTTIDTRPDSGTSLGTDTPAGRAVSAVVSWITTADHKRIGRSFVAISLLFLVGMTVIGSLLGFERLQPDGIALDADSIDQLFSLFRVGSAFFVLAPLLLGIALAVVPLQLGARSLALPRAASLGLWTWVAGGVIVVVAYVNNGGPGGGEENMVDLFLMGLALACIGLVLAAGSIVVSVLTTRAPGMTIARVPLFSWSALVGGVAVVLTLPVLVGDLILLTVDHRYGRTAFGGNTGITTWMGWALTQPATYVYAVPALGIAAEIIATATHRRPPMRGAVLLGIGIFATATLAAVTQRTHDLPWGGDSFFGDFGDKFNDLLPYALFNLLPILGVLIVLGVGGLALKSSRPTVSAPLVFALLGLLMLLTGVLAHALTPIVDLQLADTVYEEGVFVYVAYGAILTAFGAVAHWGPKLWGRRIADKQAIPLALLGFLATILASLPLLLAGFQGQPAGAPGGYDYDLAPELLNALVFAGHALMLITVVAFSLLALRSFATGEPAGDDPWNGQTLEWATSSPPPPDNFSDVRTVASATPVLDLQPARSDA